MLTTTRIRRRWQQAVAARREAWLAGWIAFAWASGAIVLFAGTPFFWFAWQFETSLCPNYAAMEPERGFRAILDEPLPTGISDYHCASFRGLDRNVWLRFRATPEAIRAITAGWVKNPADEKSLADFLGTWGSVSFVPPEAVVFGWTRVHHTRPLHWWSKFERENSQRVLLWDAEGGIAYCHWMTM